MEVEGEDDAGDETMVVLGRGTYGTVLGDVPIKGKCCKVVNSRLHTTSLLREITFANVARISIKLEAIEQLLVLPDRNVFWMGKDTPCTQMVQHTCSLTNYIERCGVLRTVSQLRHLHDALVAGTEALLMAGVAMCDVAPGNVLLGKDGQWRLCDLGLSRINSPAVSRSYVFTIGVRAPELMDARRYGCDLVAAHAWAIGATLLIAATNQIPTVNETSSHAALYDLVCNVRCFEDGVKPLPLGYADVYGDLLRFDPARRRQLRQGPPPPEAICPGYRRNGTPWCTEFRKSVVVKVVECALLTFSSTTVAIMAMLMVDELCGREPHLRADNTKKSDHEMIAYAALTLAADLALEHASPLNNLTRTSVFGHGVITDAFKNCLTKWHITLFNACRQHPVLVTEAAPWSEVELLRDKPDRYYRRHLL